MIRILHVMGGLNSGGSETLIMNYYRKIDRSKYQFDFVIHSSNKQFYEDEILKLGGNIYRLPKYTIINHFSYIRSWKKLLSNLKSVQIVHGHMRSTAAIYLSLAKKYKKVTICHSHSTSNGFGFKSIVQFFYQLPIRYISDYFLACSKKAGSWLFGKKVLNSNKCLIIPNSIETKKFLFNSDMRISLRKQLSLEKDDIVIGHVGRFVPAKNHKFIIDVFKLLYNNNNKYKLLLIGDGILKNKIQKYINKLDCRDNIIMLSSKNDIYNYYNVFDIFLFPSKFEGFGMTLVEAQINGLPCFTGNCIPNEAIFSNKCYRYNYNSSLFADKIINLKDYDRKIDLNNLDYYDIENNVDRLCHFYDKVCGCKNE